MNKRIIILIIRILLYYMILANSVELLPAVVGLIALAVIDLFED